MINIESKLSHCRKKLGGLKGDTKEVKGGTYIEKHPHTNPPTLLSAKKE